MNLQQAIQQSMFNGLTDAQALAAGNASTTWPATVNTIYNYNLIATNYGPTLAEQLGSLILASGFPLAQGAYVTVGINLSLAVVQSELAAMQAATATANPALSGLLGTLAAIGQPSGTYWQSWGVAQPLLADITAARASIATQAAVNRITNAWTVVSDALSANQITTWEQAVALWGQQ